MSEKFSNFKLERQLGSASGLARRGAIVYQTTRNLMLGVGLTAAVFLPLTASKEQQTPEEKTVIKMLPTQPVVVTNQLEMPDTLKINTTPDIDVAVLTSPISGAPRMSRAWHRTTFSRTGDEFWALPDAQFVLRFTRGENFETCKGPTCTGTLALMTLQNTSSSEALLATIKVNKDRKVETSWEECRTLRPDVVVTQTLACRLRGVADGGADVCLWLRSSEHPEVEPVFGNSAPPVPDRKLVGKTLPLDIRWQIIDPDPDPNPKPATCPDF